MPLADWLIPKPSLAAQAQLQHSLVVLRAEGRTNIEKTLDITESLLRQNMHYHTLLNQAIRHIAELELREILNTEPSQPSSCCTESSGS